MKRLAIVLLCVFSLGCSSSHGGADSVSGEQAQSPACMMAALTTQEAEAIAKREFETRGGRFTSDYDVKISTSQSCDYVVFVSFIPPQPGAHFYIVLSGKDKSVKNYFGGR